MYVGRGTPAAADTARERNSCDTATPPGKTVTVRSPSRDAWGEEEPGAAKNRLIERREVQRWAAEAAGMPLTVTASKVAGLKDGELALRLLANIFPCLRRCLQHHIQVRIPFCPLARLPQPLSTPHPRVRTGTSTP